MPEVTAQPETSVPAPESTTSAATAPQAEQAEDTVVVDKAVEEPIEDAYLLPTDTTYLTARDLQGFTAEEIRLIRNEIYARYGVS